jgi:hypothetical protein
LLSQFSTAAELLRRNVLPSIAYICGRQRFHFPNIGPNANAGAHKYNANPSLPHKHNKETKSRQLFHVVIVVCLPMMSVTSYYAASTCRMTDLRIIWGQWFPNCAPRITRDPRPVTRGSMDTFL